MSPIIYDAHRITNRVAVDNIIANNADTIAICVNLTRIVGVGASVASSNKAVTVRIGVDITTYLAVELMENSEEISTISEVIGAETVGLTKGQNTLTSQYIEFNRRSLTQRCTRKSKKLALTRMSGTISLVKIKL